jgi:hypothetical protein
VSPANNESTGTDVVAAGNPWSGIDVPYEAADDPEEMSRRIIAQVLEATSLEEVDAAWASSDMKAIAGKAFQIMEVTFTEYESERGVIPMARVTAVDLSTQKEVEWRSTSTAVVAQLIKIHQLDGYGTDWRVVGAKTRSGNTAYHLEHV